MKGRVMSHQAITFANEIRNADLCLPFEVAIFDEPLNTHDEENWTQVTHNKKSNTKIRFVIKCTSTKLTGITGDRKKISDAMGPEWDHEISKMSMKMCQDHEYICSVTTKSPIKFCHLLLSQSCYF